jgi:ATP-dependent protease HslVU (ClpYQ) ATPase subunit
VMATLMEDLLFDLPETRERRFVFDGARVRDRLMAIVTDDDLRRYIL